MKKSKWTFIFLLSAVMILATMQSAPAMGKAAIDAFAIVNNQAPGATYAGTLVIYYLAEEPRAGEFEDPPVAVVGPPGPPPCGETDGPARMLFFATLQKGNNLFAFSYESEVIICLTDSDAQTAEILFFKDLLVGQLFDPIPSSYEVKSINNFVDTTALDCENKPVPPVPPPYVVYECQVTGQDLNIQPIDLGFISLEFVLAVKQ